MTVNTRLPTVAPTYTCQSVLIAIASVRTGNNAMLQMEMVTATCQYYCSYLFKDLPSIDRLDDRLILLRNSRKGTPT